jgi:site-specific recombinase XerD
LAQTLLDRGMRIEEVQQILGHTKIDTTRRYCHANQRNTENSYRKYACM